MELTVLIDAYAENKCGENVAIRRGATICPRVTRRRCNARLPMNQAESLLRRQLEAFTPRSILALGDTAAGLVKEFCRQASDCDLVSLDASQTAGELLSRADSRRHDFGLVAGFLEQVDQETGSAVLARVRDVLVRRLCVVVEDPQGEDREVQWSNAEMAALGFSFLGRFEIEGCGLEFYGFDIANYKQTPDWLNARHWANPERWNKDRW